MEKFISDSPSKTPRMQVNVMDSDGTFIEQYDVPQGFQLEKYVNSIHPDSTLQITFPKIGPNRHFKVDICDDNLKIMQTHLGLYLDE